MEVKEVEEIKEVKERLEDDPSTGARCIRRIIRILYFLYLLYFLYFGRLFYCMRYWTVMLASAGLVVQPAAAVCTLRVNEAAAA